MILPPISPRRTKALFFLAGLLCLPRGEARSADASRIFFADDPAGLEDGRAVVTVLGSSTIPVEGIQFSVCHDATRLTADTPSIWGLDVQALNEGEGPQYLKINQPEGRVDFFMIINYPSPAPAILDPGAWSLLSIPYRQVSGAPTGKTTLTICQDFVVAAFSDDKGGEIFPETDSKDLVIGDAPAARFIRGDVDADGHIDITDPILLLGHLFTGRPAPRCQAGADIDDSDALDLADGIYSLEYQFLSGPPPAGPFPGCGEDPSPGSLDCTGGSGCP
jgi:hypothetical protein